VTLASLKPGQTVLDLGSGGGIDCFLAAKKVGPQGRVIGVDMTPEMLDRARTNRSKLGAENVEFRLGEIEHLPVADNSVDVVISNCVINLSTDKPQVLHEILRVLKPGGRMAVSDIVTRGELPQKVKESLSAWAGCIAGAMDADDMTALMKKTGFTNIALAPVYFSEEMVDDAIKQYDSPEKLDKEALSKSIFSANISGEKPG
jgi:arsenite methyltransferase